MTSDTHEIKLKVVCIHLRITGLFCPLTRLITVRCSGFPSASTWNSTVVVDGFGDRFRLIHIRFVRIRSCSVSSISVSNVSGVVFRSIESVSGISISARQLRRYTPPSDV